jgi:hypothetical protein
MAFRSHVTRALNFSVRSNQVGVGLTLVAGVVAVGLVVLTDRNPWLIVSGSVATFVTWAVARELDPDRTLTATVAASSTAIWVLSGSGVALLPLVAFIFIPRLLVESTGRRPLTTDLVALGLFAAAISYTAAGWVAGFGVAVAIYLDNRIADRKHVFATVIALTTAVGASLVATLTGAFPQEIPDVRPVLAISLGVLAIVAALREPPDPVSQVDSRRKTFLLKERLHVARTVTALAIFGGVLLSGVEGTGLVPGAIALALALASSEVERIQRNG